MFGHSVSEVDIVYFYEIISNVVKTFHWYFTYYTEKDLSNIYRFNSSRGVVEMHDIVVVGVDLKDDKTLVDVKKYLEKKLGNPKIRNYEVRSLLDKFTDYPQYDPNEDKLVGVNFDLSYETRDYKLGLELMTYQKDIDIYTLNVKMMSEDINHKSIFLLKKYIAIVFQRYFGSFYWQHDSHNEEVSSGLYKLIHGVENNLRNLVITYMLKIYGSEWFDDTILPSYRNKSKEFNEWYIGSKYQTFKKVKSELFNLQVMDLIDMLKESYPNAQLNKVLNHYNAIVHALSSDSSQIVNPDLKEIETLWVEMKFDDILGSDFRIKWEKFSKLRNIIAHNKLVCIELNNDIRAEVVSLNEIINNGRTIVDDRISSNERSQIKSLMRDINADFLIQDSGLYVYSGVQDVIDDLYEKNEIVEFYYKLEEYESKLTSVFEDILCTLYEVSNIDIHTVGSKSEFLEAILDLIQMYDKENVDLYKSIINIGNDELKCELFMSFQDTLAGLRAMFDEKVNQFHNTGIDAFNEELLIHIPYIYPSSVLSICLDGSIEPSFGSTDRLNLRIKSKDDVLAVGEITIDYGNYEVDDDTGTGRQSALQDMDIRIDEVIECLNNMIEEVEKLESVIGEISKYVID